MLAFVKELQNNKKLNCVCWQIARWNLLFLILESYNVSCDLIEIYFESRIVVQQKERETWNIKTLTCDLSWVLNNVLLKHKVRQFIAFFKFRSQYGLFKETRYARLLLSICNPSIFQCMLCWTSQINVSASVQSLNISVYVMLD